MLRVIPTTGLCHFSITQSLSLNKELLNNFKELKTTPIMEITGSSIYFTDEERKIIKKLIDKEYGKTSTSIDYETTSGLHDTGIEGDFFQKTGQHISGSTLERIVGLTKEKRKTSMSNVEKITKYLSFRNVEIFLSFLAGQATQKKVEKFNPLSFLQNHIINILYGSNMHIKARFLNENELEIVFVEKAKLKVGDKVKIKNIIIGEELDFSNIIRKVDGKILNMGSYRSGIANTISSIYLEN